MCLAVPGQVRDIRDDHGLRMATVDFGGVTKEACLEYVPEVGPGDWVIVHVGFAITQLDEQAAQETLALLREAGRLEADLLETDLLETDLRGVELGPDADPAR